MSDAIGKSTIGYKSPPLWGRWRPGESENPKGRPKGTTKFAMSHAELQGAIAVNSRPKRGSKTGKEQE